jgi:AraC-like DNA-binding protein
VPYPLFILFTITEDISVMTELFNDIRSLYRFKDPCDGLKNHIEFFSETCFESTKQIMNDQSFSIKMFKSWTPTFWINPGPSYRLVLNGTIHRINANSAIAVTRNVTAERINHPSDHLFTVKFYPGALKYLFDVDQTKLSSGLVELNELLPESLIQQIKSAGCFEQRIALMEQFILKKASNKKEIDHYSSLVMRAIGFYNHDGMKFNVNEIAFKTFTSSKTLRRYFERVIGVSPKQYFESVRLRTAFRSFLYDRKNFDPVEFGYYDRSHFYKSVTQFTGERIAEHY